MELSRIAVLAAIEFMSLMPLAAQPALITAPAPPGAPIEIAGRVTNSTGNPFSFPITVTLSGSSGGVVNTAADGSFSFANLPAGGSYTVSPSGSGLYFAPATFSTAPGSLWVPFVNRQFGTQIWNNGGGGTSGTTTHWRFLATFPKMTTATYGFYHLSISDSADPNSPTGTHCHVAGYINGYPEPGIERSFFVLNPPTDGAIGRLIQQTNDVQDNRACALDAKNSKIQFNATTNSIEMEAAMIFKPWFTAATKGVYTQAAECCWTSIPWTRHTAAFNFGTSSGSVAPSTGSGGRRTFFLSFPYTVTEAGRFYELLIGDYNNRGAGVCNALIAPWADVSFLIDRVGQWRPQTYLGDPSYSSQPNGLWYQGAAGQTYPPPNSSVSGVDCRMTVNPVSPLQIHVLGDYPDPNTVATPSAPYQHYQRYNTAPPSSPSTITANMRVMVEILPGGAFTGPKDIWIRTWNGAQTGEWQWRGQWNVQ